MGGEEAHGQLRHQISKKVQAANYNFVTQEQLQEITEIHEKPSNQHIEQ
jgi:hypothetical protein